MSVETFAEAIVLADTSNLEPGTPEWLSLRKVGIGGSDAAAICGLDRYRSPLAVYLDKVGALPDEVREENEAMHWGRVLEPIVAEETQLRTGVKLFEVSSLLGSAEHHWMVANIDRGADDGTVFGIYEGKTASVYVGDEWGDTDNPLVPDAYQIQGMHYLAVTGLPWVLYGVLIGGQRLVTRMVMRDQELIDHLVTIETEFWERVQNETPPMPDGSKSTTDLLGHLWDVQPETILTLDPAEVGPIIARRHEAAAEIKAAEERKAEAENQLKMILGENETAVDPEGRKLYTWKMIPESEVAATTRKAYRRLTIPKAKTT